LKPGRFAGHGSDRGADVEVGLGVEEDGAEVGVVVVLAPEAVLP
jgi:hypothetical protein